MIDDVVGRGEDAVGEPVVAHELPGVLGRVELGRFGRQGHDGDVGREREPVGDVPARLVDQHDGVGIGGDGLGYLGEMQVIASMLQNGRTRPAALPSAGQIAPKM